MAERLPDYHPSAIDVLDRVLDKGIVIDGWWRISLAGLNLVTMDGRIVVASIETYLRHAPVLAHTNPFPWQELEVAAWPSPEPVSPRAAAPKKRRTRAS
jgi:gas vesicle structural protein